MIYLLDTNICIYFVKQHPIRVLQKFRTLAIDDVGISSICVAELQFGVERSSNPSQNQQALNSILSSIQVVPFDHAAAILYGQTRSQLERRGMPIGPFDTMIAAHALSLGIILVTNNEKEFKRVAGLQVENWV